MPDSSPVETPKSACDLIVEGDIADGFTFPAQAAALAGERRLRTIAAVSAGTLPAAVLAAAEHARGSGGIERLASIAQSFEKHRPRLLQPAPDARPLWALAKEGLGERRVGRAVRGLLFHHGQFVLVGAMVAFTLGLFSAAIGGSLFGVVFAFLVFFAVAIALSAWSVTSNASDVLRANDFGLAPGPTQEDAEGVGLSDWLAEAIEEAAGRGLPEDPEELRAPLTFGDLARGSHPVTLTFAATDLSARAPMLLPCIEDLFFDEAEMRRVVPGWVVDWMVGRAGAAKGPREGLWALPHSDDMPVVVGARLALGFPGLISAVPLYREGEGGHVRMLVVDGALSGGLPVDAVTGLLPARPILRLSTGGAVAADPVTPTGTRAAFTAAFESLRAAQDRMAPPVPAAADAGGDDDERWRRFALAYGALEELLVQSDARWTASEDGESARDAMKRIAKARGADAAAMVARFDGLMTHVDGWDAPLAGKAGDDASACRLRLTQKV